MRSTPAAIVTAPALLLALAACSFAPLPDPPTEQDAQRHYAAALDQSWLATGLSGLEDRPVVEANPPVDEEEWPKVLYACMLERGYTLSGFGGSANGGYFIENFATESPTSSYSDGQRSFYVCLAENPVNLSLSKDVFSVAQLQFIYDYYATTLVPCLEAHGYSVRTAPSRDEFVAMAGEWSPVQSMQVIDIADFQASSDICGDELPPLY